MRAFFVLFAAVFADMTVDAEEVEGLMSEEELDEIYDDLDANKDGILAESEVSCNLSRLATPGTPRYENPYSRGNQMNI